MIFHDTVDVVMQVPFDPPQYDGYGAEILDLVSDTLHAEVFPLDTDAAVSVDSTIVTSRYRMVLAPTIDIPPKIGNSLRIGWGAFVLKASPFSVGSGLAVDGAVERHVLRGRLHHYELITKNVMA